MPFGAWTSCGSAGPEEPCWGYPFDVQSRVLHYSRGQPNTIATAFAGHALLDAHASLGDAGLLETARGAGRFFLRRVPQTERGGWRLLRLSARRPLADPQLQHAGGGAARATVGVGLIRCRGLRPRRRLRRPVYDRPPARRRLLALWGEAGSGLGGQLPHGLRARRTSGLRRRGRRGGRRRRRPGAEASRTTAVRLFLDDGTPRYYPNRVFPLDAQSVAQGIQTLSIAARHDRSCARQAWKVFGFGLRRMLGDDGLPIFQRRRLWSNRARHFRWVVAPMLLALTHLLALERAAAPDPGPEVPAAARVGVAG